MTKLISKHDLREVKGLDLSPRYIAKLVRQGRFPKPIPIAGGRRKMFIESEVDQYIASRIAKRDAEVAR